MKTSKSLQSRKSNTSTAASLSHLKASRLKARRQSKMNSKAEKSRSTKRVTTKAYWWTAKEHKVCMKAVQKHGKNYRLIALAVKTRNHRQIKYRLENLFEQMKVDKHHPDRHILRPFEKWPAVRRNWTRKETEVLVEAVNKYGQNYV